VTASSKKELVDLPQGGVEGTTRWIVVDRQVSSHVRCKCIWSVSITLIDVLLCCRSLESQSSTCIRRPQSDHWLEFIVHYHPVGQSGKQNAKEMRRTLYSKITTSNADVRDFPFHRIRPSQRRNVRGVVQNNYKDIIYEIPRVDVREKNEANSEFRFSSGYNKSMAARGLETQT
jgi:hypothetical protein